MSFVMVHQHLKKAKRRQARYADKNDHYTEFQVGEHVYLKQQQCKSELPGRWYLFNRIIEKATSVTFHLKNQLDGPITKAHAEQLQLAQLDSWEIPKNKKGRPACKVRYAASVHYRSKKVILRIQKKKNP